jgi:integrase
MDIKEYIKSKRPNLGKSSITTYSSILRNLYKNIWGEGFDPDKFNDAPKVLEHLKDITPNKRKTILSALVIITDNDKYRDKMKDDVNAYNQEIAQQKLTPEQKENWINESDIENVLASLKKTADALYKKRPHLTNAELQQIQNYIIIALLSGQYIPVRRSKDYCDFKIKNINKETDNYIDGNELVFNSFKTAKAKGQQRLPYPIKLRNILKKWIDINPTDYLLFDQNFNPLTAVKLNQRINKLFGEKKVGVNGLRHSILTEKFGDVIAKKKEIEKVMNDMGSSANMLTTYVKDI